MSLRPRRFDMERGRRMASMHDSGLTYREIGRRFDITGVRVGQVIARYREIMESGQFVTRGIIMRDVGISWEARAWERVNEKMYRISSAITEQLNQENE